MKNHYVLPVCFAAAAHGALLFGFSKGPRQPMASEEKTVLVPFVVPPREEDPPVIVEPDRSDAASKSAPDVPSLPRSAEPLAIDLGERIPITPPPLGEVTTRDVTTIFEHSIGQLGGEGKNPFGNVISSTHLDNPPRTRFQATPMYPFEAKRNGMNGQVLVEFLVDERGHVLEPRVVNSTNRIFEEATLRAVAKWQFEPGRRDGRIVRFRMSAPVVFNLND
jgi:periplasmic protein TonB